MVFAVVRDRLSASRTQSVRDGPIRVGTHGDWSSGYVWMCLGG